MLIPHRTHLACLLLPLVGACVGTREAADATLRIYGETGSELGVCTSYGLVFLGRTVRAGNIEVEAHFGDGPNLESTVVEPISHGLYTAETEIRLPSVPLKFHDPKPGDKLILRGRTEDGAWESDVTVHADDRVHGLLISAPAIMLRRDDQVGAGVFWSNPFDANDRRLIGLVSARIRLDGETYLCVVGPRYLWRLVTHRRDLLRRKPWVYREDIM
jgi:hypothetical protein